MVVSIVNPELHQREQVTTRRIVHQYKDLDPDLVVPAGTKRANNSVIQEDITNRELVENGNNPFVEIVDENGSTRIEQIEYHHVTGEESVKGSKFFTGEEYDGSVVELPHSLHVKYHAKVRRIKSGYSFRNDPYQRKKFNAFKKKYLKDRFNK